MYWPELKHLYMELYHDDAMLEALRRQLAAFSDTRRESLKQRDAEKQDNPNWYQSRELLGVFNFGQEATQILLPHGAAENLLTGVACVRAIAIPARDFAWLRQEV